MKHKKLLAMVLAAILTVSAITVTSFAVSAEENAETAVQQTDEQTASAKKKSGECCKKGGAREKKEKIAEPENAIGKSAAKEAAVADAGVTVDDTVKVRAKLRKLEDGTVVYKVSFTVDGVYRCYKIDALTGKIVEKSEMSAEEHEAAKPQEKARGEKSSDTDDGGKPAGKRHGKGKGKTADAAGDNTSPSAAESKTE